MPDSDSDRQLIEAATEARGHAIAAFSNYRVGAALLGTSGTVYTGCNIENAIMSLSACAEVVALHKALSTGERSFRTVAVVTESTPPAVPCGVCRQLLHHWGVKRVVVANLIGEQDEVGIELLLPRPFELRRQAD